MTRRGRKPIGPQLVEHLEGSLHAKTRLTVILETVTGQRTIADACSELGIHESMFHKMRSEVLQTALGRLEPRPLGRPSHTLSPEDQRVVQLEEENQDLRAELRAAEIRRELAVALPRLSRPAGTGSKRSEVPVPLPSGKKTTHSNTPGTVPVFVPRKRDCPPPTS
jgi:transposase-like protein